MGQIRGTARAFVVLVVAAGGILLALQWGVAGWPQGENVLLILVCFALASTTADIWGFRLHYKRLMTMTLSTAVNFAAMMLFGPAASATLGAVASALADSWARRAWYKLVFNCASTVISVSAASAAYNLLNDGSVVPLASPRNALAIVGAGLVYLGVNTGIISTIVGLCEGYNPWQMWRASYQGVYFQLLTLVPLGTLIVIVYYQSVWGLLLLLFPIVLTHASYESYRQLQTQSQRTMETLADAVDRRDAYTYRHSERVAAFSERIAHRLNLDLTDTETVAAAARVHDLGKIGIPSSVLLKPGALNSDEWRQMREHPRIGAEILAQLPMYERVRVLVAYHQERYDGKGYPYGLSGDRLPLGARIIAVADAYEAMTSDRPYRKALSPQVALAELRRGRGTQFDPQVVDAFLAVLEERPEERAALAKPATNEQAVG